MSLSVLLLTMLCDPTGDQCEVSSALPPRAFYAETLDEAHDLCAAGAELRVKEAKASGVAPATLNGQIANLCIPPKSVLEARSRDS